MRPGTSVWRMYSHQAMAMPMSASASETTISRPPSPAQANASCSTSKNTGSRKPCSQPLSGGTPTTRPSRAAGMARRMSGTVMIGGLSWMCACTSASARFSPKNVRKMRRNT